MSKEENDNRNSVVDLICAGGLTYTSGSGLSGFRIPVSLVDHGHGVRTLDVRPDVRGKVLGGSSLFTLHSEHQSDDKNFQDQIAQIDDLSDKCDKDEKNQEKFLAVDVSPGQDEVHFLCECVSGSVFSDVPEERKPGSTRKRRFCDAAPSLLDSALQPNQARKGLKSYLKAHYF